MNADAKASLNAPPRGMKWRTGWALLAAIWVTTLPLFGGEFAIVPLVLLMVVPFWRRAPKITLLLLLTPSSFMFFNGIANWFDDRPALQFMGLPGYSADSLNRETRCFQASGGCMVYGGEYLLQGAHNLGLRSMVSLFGWPPKTYHGPFPTPDEAVALLKSSGTRLSPSELSSGHLVAGTNHLVLHKKFVELLPHDSGQLFFFIDDETPSGFADVARFQDRCWIVRLVSKDSLNRSPSGNSDCIYLIDGISGEAFARYAISGRPLRFSSVLHGRWRGRER